MESAWPHIWAPPLPSPSHSLPERVQSCSNQPQVTTEHVLFAPRLKTPTHTLKHTDKKKQKTHKALLQIVLSRTPSTTKTNTCERVTLRGCNLQENPIWQSSYQRGSRIDCSRGAHRVASCPSTLSYQLHTHTHTFEGELEVGSGPTAAVIKFMPLVLMEKCRARFSFEQGLIFMAQCIDLAGGISVAK